MADRSCWADYEVSKELGRGTWGTVLLARRRQDASFYALKIVQLDKRSNKDQLAAVQECQLLASLDSPHITRYYDSFLHEGKLVIVMEWAQGGSLHAAIGRSPRPLAEEAIWRVLLHIALALHHMHSRRMLHRDVKSLNVFLTGPLDVSGRHTAFKLGDVGVAKVLEEGKSHASTLIGTPFYLSPEICQEKPYDSKSDMWALGVVLYECATKRHPFDAQSQPSLIMKILKGRYEPVLGLSSDLTAIIHRCLSPAPNRRPSAELLLSLPPVRAKAAEMGIELPLSVLTALPSALSGGGHYEGGKKSSLGGGVGMRVSIDARAGGMARPPQPPARRATCPHAPPPEGAAQQPLAAGVGRLAAAAVVGRRSLQEGGAVTERQQERRKPPLPAAAVPHRRKTEQQSSARQSVSGDAPSPPSARQLSVASPAAVRPLEARLAAGQASPVAPALQVAESPVLEAGQAPSNNGSFSLAGQPSSRRQSHFDVQQHLRQLSGAAQQWLAHRGSTSSGQGSGSEGYPGGGASGAPPSLLSAASLVERSTKSDSSLLPPRRLTDHARSGLSCEAHDVGLAHAAAMAAAVAAVGAEAEEEERRAAAAQQLRKRCIALLGSEELFEELHGLAVTAVEGGPASGDVSASGGGAATPRPPTMAALGDLLFLRVGYSGNAAEALHLLMRLLVCE